VILDAFNRGAIIWAVADHDIPDRDERPVGRDQNPTATRRMDSPSDCDHQFTAHDWINTARTHALARSIGPRKGCFDNAACGIR
jgi:hypothetical protein